jgi:hypothetical protein
VPQAAQQVWRAKTALRMAAGMRAFLVMAFSYGLACPMTNIRTNRVVGQAINANKSHYFSLFFRS